MVPNPPEADEGLLQKAAGLDSWEGGQGRAALLCAAAARALLLLIEQRRFFIYPSTNPGNKLTQFQGTPAIWEWQIPAREQ